MKIVSIVGARPQFVKCAAVSREIRKDHIEILVHTGQHYDPEMSNIFFKELEIPQPDYNLKVGSGSQGNQTGEILARVEKILFEEHPDLVLVYGDANSTLAGALAAAKMQIPVAHVEAGLRSFDRTMPEEINRVLTDHISDVLFCPTQTAVNNLAHEGITNGVHLTGDVMVDALRFNIGIAEKRSRILKDLALDKNRYLVMTVHRPANTDSKENMKNILNAVRDSGKTTIFPAHPRTVKYLQDYGFWDTISSNIIVTEPLGYLDMIQIMSHAEKILTDSGGIQKEAYILGVPCVTLRENSEWVETVNDGWNVLVGADSKRILKSITSIKSGSIRRDVFGKGDASMRIRNILSSKS